LPTGASPLGAVFGGYPERRCACAHRLAPFRARSERVTARSAVPRSYQLCAASGPLETAHSPERRTAVSYQLMRHFGPARNGSQPGAPYRGLAICAPFRARSKRVTARSAVLSAFRERSCRTGGMLERALRLPGRRGAYRLPTAPIPWALCFSTAARVLVAWPASYPRMRARSGGRAGRAAALYAKIVRRLLMP